MKRIEQRIGLCRAGEKEPTELTVPAYVYGPFAIHRDHAAETLEPRNGKRSDWILATRTGGLKITDRPTRRGCVEVADALLEAEPEDVWTFPFSRPRIAFKWAEKNFRGDKNRLAKIVRSDIGH